MGNSCKSCCEEIDDYERDILIKFGLANPEFQSISDSSSINIINKNEDSILDILTEESISQIFQVFYINLQNCLKMKEIKKSLIFNNKLDFLKNNLKFWARFDDQEKSSHKIHNYYFEVECPFTPELVLLYLSNLDKKNEIKLSNQISTTEKINHIETDENIMIINKMRTKKSFANNPRDFFKLSIFKKLENENYEQSEISCQFTELYKLESIRKINNELKDEALIYISGYKFEKSERGWIIKHSRKIDPLSPFGLILAKGFLKKIMKTFFNNLFINLTEFLILRKKMKNWDGLVWFNNSKSYIKNIIEKNYEILNLLNFDNEFLSKETQEVFEKKSVLGSDLLDSSDDEILKESKNDNYEIFKISEKIQKSESYENNSFNKFEKKNSSKNFTFNKKNSEHFLDGDKEDQFLSFNDQNLEKILSDKKDKENVTEKLQLDILLEEENENSEKKISISKHFSFSEEKKIKENKDVNFINIFEDKNNVSREDLMKIDDNLKKSEIEMQKIEELGKIGFGDENMESFEDEEEKSINDNLKKEFEEEDKNFISHYGDKEEDLKENKEEEVKEVNENIEEVKEVNENVKEVKEVNENVKEVKENIKEVKEVNENVEVITEEVKKDVEEFEEVEDEVKKGVEEVEEEIKKGVEEVKEVVKEITEEVKEDFKQIKEEVKEVKKGVEEIEKEIKKGVEEVKEELKEVKKEVNQEIKNKKEKRIEEVVEIEIKSVEDEISLDKEEEEKIKLNSEIQIQPEVVKVVESMREKTTFDSLRENADRTALKEEKVIKKNNDFEKIDKSDEDKFKEFLNNENNNLDEELENENCEISREITMSDFEDNGNIENMEYSEDEENSLIQKKPENNLEEFLEEKKENEINVEILEKEKNISKEDFVQISDEDLNSPLNKLVKE